MYQIALKMLFADRAKYLGLVLGILFSTFLMAQQVSVFTGIIKRSGSQIQDVSEADIWVMDPRVQVFDELRPLPDRDLLRVRSIPGVEWALPHFKGPAIMTIGPERMQQVMLTGVDDTTLIGGPPRMLMGKWEDIRMPNALIVDGAGYKSIWPGEEFELGRTVEMNEKRAVVVGIAEATPPFVFFPVVYSRYSEAKFLAPMQRNSMSLVLVKARAGENHEALAQVISDRTGLKALTAEQFKRLTATYYLTHTGITVNFGMTVILGFIVGAAIAGQTFYMFIIENLRQFGALKALGVTNRQLVRMVGLQAVVAGCTGYGIGCGMAALFFAIASNAPLMRGLSLTLPVMAGVAIAVAFIMSVAAFFSIRRLIHVDPASVFRN